MTVQKMFSIALQRHSAGLAGRTGVGNAACAIEIVMVAYCVAVLALAGGSIPGRFSRATLMRALRVAEFALAVSVPYIHHASMLISSTVRADCVAICASVMIFVPTEMAAYSATGCAYAAAPFAINGVYIILNATLIKIFNTYRAFMTTASPAPRAGKATATDHLPFVREGCNHFITLAAGKRYVFDLLAGSISRDGNIIGYRNCSAVRALGLVSFS